MSKSNPHNLTPGQTLWFVPDGNRRGGPEFVTAATVGTNWATLADARRVLLKTLEMEGYANGRCHLSRDVYEGGLALDKAWRAATLPYTRPRHVTAEDIAAIRAIVEGKY